MGDTYIRARVDHGLKKAFQKVCKANDLTVSQVLRYFMRQYVANNGEDLQRGLFEEGVSAAAAGQQTKG